MNRRFIASCMLIRRLSIAYTAGGYSSDEDNNKVKRPSTKAIKDPTNEDEDVDEQEDDDDEEDMIAALGK